MTEQMLKMRKSMEGLIPIINTIIHDYYLAVHEWNWLEIPWIAKDQMVPPNDLHPQERQHVN